MTNLISTISAVLFLTSCDKDEYQSPYDECGCWADEPIKATRQDEEKRGRFILTTN